MSPDTLPGLVTAVIAGLGALGIWVSTKEALARIEAQMQMLTAQVEKHSDAVERTLRLDEKVTTIYRLHDELKAEVAAMRKEHE